MKHQNHFQDHHKLVSKTSVSFLQSQTTKQIRDSSAQKARLKGIRGKTKHTHTHKTKGDYWSRVSKVPLLVRPTTREPHGSGPPPFWYTLVTEVKFKPMMPLWL